MIKIHKSIDTDRQTDGRTSRQGSRHMDRKIDKKADRHIDRRPFVMSNEIVQFFPLQPDKLSVRQQTS